MPQLFSPVSNTLARLTILAVVVSLTAGSALAWSLYHSNYSNKIGIHRVQPVPFSHEHHVGELGLDCRYCHSSVEIAADAGMPASETCMHCHSVIWQDSPTLAPVRDSYVNDLPLSWQRINRVPDYVYFNHAQHISHGVGCSTCHGRVDQMAYTARTADLTMRWCIDCHENPEPQLRPREQVFNMAYQAQGGDPRRGETLTAEYHVDKSRLLDCDTCHR